MPQHKLRLSQPPITKAPPALDARLPHGRRGVLREGRREVPGPRSILWQRCSVLRAERSDLLRFRSDLRGRCAVFRGRRGVVRRVRGVVSLSEATSPQASRNLRTTARPSLATLRRLDRTGRSPGIPDRRMDATSQPSGTLRRSIAVTPCSLAVLRQNTPESRQTNRVRASLGDEGAGSGSGAVPQGDYRPWHGWRGAAAVESGEDSRGD